MFVVVVVVEKREWSFLPVYEGLFILCEKVLCTRTVPLIQGGSCACAACFALALAARVRSCVRSLLDYSRCGVEWTILRTGSHIFGMRVCVRVCVGGSAELSQNPAVRILQHVTYALALLALGARLPGGQPPANVSFMVEADADITPSATKSAKYPSVAIPFNRLLARAHQSYHGRRRFWCARPP